MPPVRPPERVRRQLLLVVRQPLAQRGRSDAEPHRARRAPGARRGARRGAWPSSPRAWGCWSSAGARTPGAGTCSTATRPRSAATPIPTSSSTTSRCRAATPSVRAGSGGYEVSDVGSLNGTYVDHKRVETAPLHHLARSPDRALRARVPRRDERLVSSRRDPSTSRSARCWPSSATSSPTSPSRRSASSRARGSSTRSARRRATASSTRTTSRACGGSSTSRRSTSCRSR